MSTKRRPPHGGPEGGTRVRLGGWEILVVLGLVLLLFGPRRLPEVGRAFGRTIQEFRKSSRSDDEDSDQQPEGNGKSKDQTGA